MCYPVIRFVTLKKRLCFCPEFLQGRQQIISWFIVRNLIFFQVLTVKNFRLDADLCLVANKTMILRLKCIVQIDWEMEKKYAIKHVQVNSQCTCAQSSYKGYFLLFSLQFHDSKKKMQVQRNTSSERISPHNFTECNLGSL